MIYKNLRLYSLILTSTRYLMIVLSILIFSTAGAAQQSNAARKLSGAIITQRFELVPNVTVEARTSEAILTTTSDAEGGFMLEVPAEPLIVKFYGSNIAPFTRVFGADENLENLQIKAVYTIPLIAESVTIEADALTPEIETRNETTYKNTLFGRDDQLIQTLNAGINAGQHEGGGKSLEIRRFGFNLDHGGANGGLKILVDNIQQNQGTQGHGQGYLGALKSLSPELVQDISIINGPFSAAYGDFSGLGVVKINLRESMPHVFTARVQSGAFNTHRGFFAYSPQWKNLNGFIAFEPAYTDGPFISKLRYRRENITGNVIYKRREKQAFGVKFNGGRSSFYSSGQIPLDLVSDGKLDRFGFIDPQNGGKVRSGTVEAYFRNERSSGATLKVDAFIGRSLFDLYSNFTFFLNDPKYGDQIQQHDSRLQEGANVQYLQPYKFFGSQALLTVGGNLLFNQINVGLYPAVDRNPNRKFIAENYFKSSVLYTSAQARVNNYAVYAQNGIDLFHGHLRLDAGLRYDFFTFKLNAFELDASSVQLTVKESSGRLQSKLAMAWSPFEKTPISFYANYGRGIASQDARGIAKNPRAPKLSTTDFYQTGAAYNSRRVSATGTFFFIDRSNEQVYIPDDGSIELAGRTRSYGLEFRNSLRISKHLSLNSGLTQVLGAFYPGSFSQSAPHRRIYIDSAPHTVANAGVILSALRGVNASLSWRHISNYRLDGEDASIRASGHDVVDLAAAKRLKKWIDLNFSIDNLLNKKYFETQNYFESRACPTCAAASRIHATPGYPFAVNIGLTLRFGAKN